MVSIGLNNSIQIRPLVQSDFVSLHKCWCTAFSDYQVSVDATTEQLRVRLAQDSYKPSISVGAFHGDEMVGFWLSGERAIAGKIVAYDAGTAIKPEWRKKGISRKLFEGLERALKQNNTNTYIVEVLTDNNDALRMYQKQGFNIKRKMDAFRIEHPGYVQLSDRIFEIEEVEIDEVRRRVTHLLDYSPSWQNSWQALEAVRESILSVIVKKEQDDVAYGIFQPILGRFAHIGVLQMEHNDMVKAINAILSHFMKYVGSNTKYEIINIPENSSKIPRLLEDLGFNGFVSLYEMERSL